MRRLFTSTERQKSHIKCVNLILKSGVDVNQGDTDGYTALMKAPKKGNKQIVNALIDAGGDVDSQNHIGISPLMIAAINGRDECVQDLIKSGAGRCEQKR